MNAFALLFLLAAADPTAEHIGALRDSLKDPASATLRNVARYEHVRGPDQVIAVCGEVNARNSYGGMSGFRRFVVSRRANYDFDVRVESPDDDPRFAAAWVDYCGSKKVQ